MMIKTPVRPSVEERLELHRAFWERRAPRPVIGFRIAPDYFFARDFAAALPLLSPGKAVTPDMIDVDAFLPDYERLYQLTEDIGQDAFWTAEPYTSIPWMEAMLGCQVHAGRESFMSKPWLESMDELESIDLRPDNPWVRKYLEFTEKLARLSAGRFPVGMPIMRGPADVAGAIMGQAEMVLAMHDEPETMQRFFLKLADIYCRLIRMQKDLTPPFHGGGALGFYHVYCPGTCTWYQEDLSTIMSPDMYRTFLREAERRICEGYDYTCVHLHPASFFILDDLLENDWLRAIEVNKDVGGPSVAEMIPEFRKITAAGKNLVLWGDITLEDLAPLRSHLPPSSLFMFVTAQSTQEAEKLLAAVRKW